MQPTKAILGDHTADAGGAEAVFHAHNVCKIFDMGEVKVQALRSVTLDLNEGEFLTKGLIEGTEVILHPGDQVAEGIRVVQCSNSRQEEV